MSRRIRVTGGPWPERVGLEGCILIPTPEQAKHYPFLGRSKDEVIVLIDDDPLNGPGTKFAGGWWTCAISKACVIDIGDWHARDDSEMCLCGAPDYLTCPDWIAGNGTVSSLTFTSATCYYSLGHRNRHQCDCVCVRPAGHDGPHQCSAEAVQP